MLRRAMTCLCCCCATGERQNVDTMVTQSQPESQNLGSASLRELLSSRQMVRSLVAFCCFEAAYYFAYRYGMSFSQATASPFWFPDSGAALRVAACAAALVAAAAGGTLPIRFFSEVAAEVPFGMLVGTAANDYLKAVIVAMLLRQASCPTRCAFSSVRDFGVYCLIAVLAIPAVSAIAGAASRGGGARCTGPTGSAGSWATRSRSSSSRRSFSTGCFGRRISASSRRRSGSRRWHSSRG